MRFPSSFPQQEIYSFVLVTFSGVKAANGTYLVGGHLPGKTQTKQAAGTTIVYTNKKNKFKDVLEIAGPTNAVLRVMVRLTFG